MLSRSLRRSVVDLGTSSCARPSALTARFFASTPTSATELATPIEPAKLAVPKAKITPVTKQRLSLPRPPELPTTPPVLDESTKKLLPLLTSQPQHYVVAHIHGFPYLVTQGDEVRLPFKIPGVVPGDILRLNRAATIGSRDYTMLGAPYVDERLFVCRATVVGTDKDPMQITEKTKRRQRKVKKVKSKIPHTLLRISELRIKDLEEVEQA